MKTHQPSFLDWLIILTATPFMHFLGLSLRIKEQGRSDLGPRGRQQEPPLWALWHETILMSVWYHRDQDVHVMISASRDGELISRVARFFGYTPVRGSTSKGATEAARHLVSYLKAGKRCAITPDGPRGPRRQVQMGAITLARLSGCPVVPFAFAAEHCWRLKSWDRFIIPKPFSRAVFVYGEPIRVPRKGGSDAEFLKQIQKELDRMTEIAEKCFNE
ncbi:MAG TPA: lysophospholipid acyltransferase family protein [bacterium]